MTRRRDAVALGSVDKKNSPHVLAHEVLMGNDLAMFVLVAIGGGGDGESGFEDLTKIGV